jgi:hypothetical protein
MKRIIRTADTKMHLGNGMVLYDGMEDFITTDDYDHTQAGTLFASTDKPVYEDQIIDSKTVRVKVSEETMLVEPDPSIREVHTFSGWEPVGTKI